jgi:hypothetical protein
MSRGNVQTVQVLCDPFSIPGLFALTISSVGSSPEFFTCAFVSPEFGVQLDITQVEQAACRADLQQVCATLKP